MTVCFICGVTGNSVNWILRLSISSAYILKNYFQIKDLYYYNYFFFLPAKSIPDFSNSIGNLMTLELNNKFILEYFYVLDKISLDAGTFIKNINWVSVLSVLSGKMPILFVWKFSFNKFDRAMGVD